MYCVVEYPDKVLKGNFKTAKAANSWCKKNLPLEYTHLWGAKMPSILVRANQRYGVVCKRDRS